MSDSEDEAGDDGEEEAEEPAVELGERTPVEGAPLARVTSRLTFPSQKSRVERREGDAAIRTPEGPQRLADVLEDVEVTYFQSTDEFVNAVEDVIGAGPVPTE